MTTLLDYKTTLKYLGYLGYEGDTRKALTKTKRIKTDSKKSHRNVFSCYVFGAPGTGKVIYIYKCIYIKILTSMTLDFTFKGLYKQTIFRKTPSDHRNLSSC
jgi:DNA replication protein DnaC